MKSKNEDKLASFMSYCAEHPEERFWQALRNWSEKSFIGVGDSMDKLQDTFYWE